MTNGWDSRDNLIHQDFNRPRKVPQAQIRLAEALFEECEFTAMQRRDWLESRYGSKYMDGLNMEEAGAVINYLIGRKKQMNTKKRSL